MEAAGNQQVNRALEAQLPPSVAKPDLAQSSVQQLEAWIRAKYELRSFAPGGDGRLPEVGGGAVERHVGMVEFEGILFVSRSPRLEPHRRAD